MSKGAPMAVDGDNLVRLRARLVVERREIAETASSAGPSETKALAEQLKHYQELIEAVDRAIADEVRIGEAN